MRRTLIGTLAATAVTSAALVVAPAHAVSWTHTDTPSGAGLLPTQLEIATADNGDAVAVWLRQVGGDTRVMAASATGGEWSPPQTVSDPGVDAHSPAVAVNEHGEAVVTWSYQDNSDRTRLAASRRLADKVGWDGRTLISPHDVDVTTQAEVALDAKNRIIAAYGAADGPVNDVRVVIQAKGQSGYASTTVSDSSGYLPSLAANPAGAAFVAWYDVQGGQSQIRGSRLAAGSTTWSASSDVSFVGLHQPMSDVAISDDGLATVVFTDIDGGETRVQAAKVQPNGSIGSPSYVSPAGQDAAFPTVSQNDAGTALAAWTSDTAGVAGVGWATRSRTGEWSASAANLPPAVTAPGAPSAAISDRGTLFVGFAGNGRQLAAYRTHPLQPMTLFDSGPAGFVAAETRAAIDDQGNALLAGVIKAGDPTQGQVHASFLDAGGPTTRLTAPGATVTAPTATVGWQATDRLSAVGTTDLWQRTTTWKGSASDWSNVVNDSAGTTAQVPLAPGRTYCFKAQSQDTANNLGLVSAERCTTTPVDDRTAKRSSGWARKTGAKHYRGTYLETKRKGATLTLKGARAKRIALVVAKVRGGGTVQVRYAGKVVGTKRLAGTGARRVLAVKTFPTVRTGKLVVKVVSRTGKRVRIDGIVLGR